MIEAKGRRKMERTLKHSLGLFSAVSLYTKIVKGEQSPIGKKYRFSLGV